MRSIWKIRLFPEKARLCPAEIFFQSARLGGWKQILTIYYMGVNPIFSAIYWIPMHFPAIFLAELTGCSISEKKITFLFFCILALGPWLIVLFAETVVFQFFQKFTKFDKIALHISDKTRQNSQNLTKINQIGLTFAAIWQIWIKLDKNSTKIHQIWPHLLRKRGKAHPSRQNVTKSHQHLTNWNQIGQEFNKNSPILFKSHPNVSKIHQIQWKFNKMGHIWMKFDKIKALKAKPLRQRLRRNLTNLDQIR